MCYFHRIYNILGEDTLGHQVYISKNCKENTGFGICIVTIKVKLILFPQNILYLSICISKLDSNISFQFIFESYSVNSRNSFHNCGFSMSNMTNCTCKGPQQKISMPQIISNIPSEKKAITMTKPHPKTVNL